MNKKVRLFPKMSTVQMARFCALYGLVLRFEWQGARFLAYAEIE
jgi:hypothetical protein